MGNPLKNEQNHNLPDIHTAPRSEGRYNNMPCYKDNKSNTWYCKFYYTNWQGEKKQKLKRGFKLQRDAKEWERNFLEQFATSPDITFQSLYDKYKRFKGNRVKASTLETQCNAIDLHILPYFKDRIVSDITPEDVAEWQTQLLGKKFSASHTRQLNAYLRMLFKYAVDYLRLPRSPVIAQICKPQKGNIDFWTPEEYRKFSEHIKDNIELYTAFEILFYTGMRKGELLALTMNDIDFQAKKIRINKTLAYVHGEYIMQPPKTEQSNRVIDVPEFLLAEIRNYTDKIYHLDPDQRIFPRSRVWLGQAITRICPAIDLKIIRVHDLRHSHASVLIDLGANPLMIAERLGHKDIKVTMNIYAHLFQSHQEEIIQKLEKLKL